MSQSAPYATRRAVLSGAAGGAVALALAACGQSGQTGQAGQGTPGASGAPVEVLWATYAPPSDVRADMWKETWKMAGRPPGSRSTSSGSRASTTWHKRQTETAAGTTSVDIISTSSTGSSPAGCKACSPTTTRYLRRDKLDTKQFYKADLESWAWKGKLWACPCRPGARRLPLQQEPVRRQGRQVPPQGLDDRRPARRLPRADRRRERASGGCRLARTASTTDGLVHVQLRGQAAQRGQGQGHLRRRRRLRAGGRVRRRPDHEAPRHPRRPRCWPTPRPGNPGWR